MINRGATLVSHLAVLIAVLFTLAACGGGGGGSSFYDENGNSSSSSSGSSSGGTVSTLALELLDPQGTATDTVTAASPGTLKATISSKEANIVVSAVTDMGELLPVSGTALTNTDGIATFQVAAGVEKGAGTITATAATSGGDISGSITFQVGDSGLRLGYFDENDTFLENQILIEPQSTLSAGGNAQVSVVILNSEGVRVTTSEEVRFSSGCIAAAQATINPALPKSVNGKASTLYTAAGCTGTDQITAGLVGASAQAFGTLIVASPKANSVNYVSADPLLIVLRGTGGLNRDETSDIIFRVTDGSGIPLPGVTVEFALSTSVGSLSLSKTSTLTDGDGQALVTVQSGDIPTVVRVTATVDDGDGNPVSTVSDQLTVTTGLPDQNSISLSAAKLIVPNAFNLNNVVNELTVNMADKFNNPVVDGTAAVFTTEYGSIVGTCTTTDGTCSVNWSSSNPRYPTLTGSTFIKTINNTGCPSLGGAFVPCPDDLGFTRGARSTVLVHAIGEESFIDRNGNGIMDEAEKDLFSNLSEAYLDENEDEEYTPGLPSCETSPMGSPRCIAGLEEIYIDFNSNTKFDRNDDPPVYNGLLCPPAGNGVWCSRTLLNVWDDIVITMSDDTTWAVILTRDNVVVTSTKTGLIQTVYIADQFNNAPPVGSTITFNANDNCEVVGQTSYAVPVRSSQGAYSVQLKTQPQNAASSDPGSVTINFTPDGGLAVQETFDCETLIPAPA